MLLETLLPVGLAARSQIVALEFQGGFSLG